MTMEELVLSLSLPGPCLSVLDLSSPASATAPVTPSPELWPAVPGYTVGREGAKGQGSCGGA